MRGEKVIGLVLAILGATVAFGGTKLGLGTVSMPGPGFFPLLSGVTLAVFSVIVLWATRPRKENDEGRSGWGNIRWRNILIVLTALTLYANFLEVVGFVVGTFLVLMVLFRAFESERWHMTVLKSVLTSGVVYAVFEKIFQLNLPQGLWGF
jgi:putative tricarboxylic transport membrane protein